MNIKAYIDYFSDISDKDRSLQFSLLTRSESHANTRFKLPIFKLLALVVPTVIIAIPLIGGYLLYAPPLWVMIILIIIALLLSRVIVSELNTWILHTSLKAVLKASDDSGS